MNRDDPHMTGTPEWYDEDRPAPSSPDTEHTPQMTIDGPHCQKCADEVAAGSPDTERVPPADPFSDAPERVKRCTTHHACDCHQWIVARWWETAQAGPPPLDVERLAEALHREVIAWTSLPEDRIWAEASSSDKRYARARARRILARLGPTQEGGA